AIGIDQVLRHGHTHADSRGCPLQECTFRWDLGNRALHKSMNKAGLPVNHADALVETIDHQQVSGRVYFQLCRERELREIRLATIAGKTQDPVPSDRLNFTRTNFSPHYEYRRSASVHRAHAVIAGVRDEKN